MPRLVAKQHLLPSSRWLFQEMVRLHLFDEINLVAKDYSAIKWVRRDIPSAVRIRETIDECFMSDDEGDLIILDEGGGLHHHLSAGPVSRTAGAEQTTFGMRQLWKCPMVLVCRSAAKSIFESQIIARGVLRKLESLEMLSGVAVGVIGLGALGSEVARCLLARGVRTFGTDPNLIPMDLRDISVSVDELVGRCDLLLGCSGVDCLRDVLLSRIGGSKIFASCSSSNIEFNSVLRSLAPKERFEAAEGWNGETHCVVLNGGFPINFDREREWERFEEILLTRRLCLSGIQQSIPLIGGFPRGVMLDPAEQLRIVTEWLERVPDRLSIRVPSTMTEDFFRDRSEGEHQFARKPQYQLHDTTPEALAQMRSHTEPYERTVMGLPILIMPGVWSPAYDWSSRFHIENLPNVHGREVLEIGCGTGVISVFLARAGAQRVVAADVNEAAVQNTIRNFERFNISNGKALQSDGLSNIRGRYDLILWNAPYHGSRPRDMLERGCADEDYISTKQFFESVSKFLKPRGLVVLGFSESGDLELIEALISANGFHLRRKLSDWRNGYNCLILELTYDGASTAPRAGNNGYA